MKTQVNPSARLCLTTIAVALLASTFLLASTLLVASGGRDSGNVVVNHSGVALFTNPASAISVGVGQSSSFSVGDGFSGAQFVGYKASSSNTQVAKVSVSDTSLQSTASPRARSS